MKTTAGILVVLGMMLTACGPMSPEDMALEEGATISERHEGTQDSAFPQGNGAEGQGAVNPEGSSSGACDETTEARNATAIIVVPTCGCGQDGCCSEVCYRDPDCGVCTVGRSCTSASQCGGWLSGRCNATTRKCSCLIQ